MKSPQQHLEERVLAAAGALLPPEAFAAATVKPCADPRHGDFQANVAMIAGKALGRPPRDVAAELAAALGEDAVAAAPQIAGPGFLNFTLKESYLDRAVAQARAEGRLGLDPVPAAAARRVVIDYGGPNIAKEMHVGHLRTHVLGAALARIHRFLGHHVVTDNHLGDWGTQFGKILSGYKEALAKDPAGTAAAMAEHPIGFLEELYQAFTEQAKTDPALDEAARRELAALQRGDAENLALWRQFVAATRAELDKIYARLDISFDETLGESAYNERLEPMVAELLSKGIARESEGATVVFFDGDAQLEDKPFLIRKSDGAFLYSTTDLATAQFRAERGVDAMIYVTDGRQQLHFQQVFATVRRWGILPECALEHAWFGAILGEDKKPLKTREGRPIKLRELLDEAESRALALITEKRPELPEARRREIARVVGLGALKYADLGQNRNLDYVFNWSKLLSFDGHTAPYLQNAYVRIRSIFRKGEVRPPAPETPVTLAEPAERALAKKLLALGETLRLAAAENRPHFLCIYLYELATAFHAFYEACPVLKAEEPARTSRLALCDLTAQALALGLELLGIGVLEEM
ncbi:MAG: arginine--tRNA ligase [Verrucomicrobium sp.]|nr:arginine--tRNA ligase [Verrucomicrobium sp.]